tara:strand:- start:3 stop:485 length:483 start_codon:yes stop_codon:yes gene_type:complete
MKITKVKLKKIIKEELEVVLTNEEVEEMFGEDVRKSVEEMEESYSRKRKIPGYKYNMSLDELRQLARNLKAIRDRFRETIPGGEGDQRFSDYYNRVISIGKTRAQTGEIDEAKLTEPEKKEKERVVKGMKKSKKDFKKRYGDDAESVMYATATKIAKDKK